MSYVAKSQKTRNTHPEIDNQGTSEVSHVSVSQASPRKRNRTDTEAVRVFLAFVDFARLLAKSWTSLGPCLEKMERFMGIVESVRTENNRLKTQLATLTI